MHERKKIRLKCEFIGFKDGRLNYACKECRKRYTKLPNEAIKNFPILCQFCNGDLNKNFLLLGKYIFNSVEKLSKFDERFIKNYDKNSNIGYALEVDVEYPIKLRIFHNDLAFLPERKKKRVRRTYLYCRRQKKYGIHITALKQAVSHGLILKRVHRVI